MAFATAEPKTLQCLEVMGGNTGTNEVLSAANIAIAIYAQPYAESAQGGDIHYVSACSADQLIRIALADVSGHGDDSSHLARHLQQLMRENIEVIDHTDFVRSLNEEFGRLSSGGHFATALISAYYKPDNTLVLCNAGHPPPFHYTAAKGTWSILDGLDNQTCAIENVPLGIIEGTDYPQFAVTVEPGDIVVMYSDSLIETTNAEGEQLHVDGLLDMVEFLGLADGRALCDALVGKVNAYRDGRPADDDESLLVLWRPQA